MTSQIDLLEAFGIDAETFEWQRLSACQGMDTDLFFDKYEGAKAKQIDELCLGCSVGKECFFDGEEKEEEGVRCGFYLIGGKPDQSKNSHKTQQIALDLAAKIYD